MKHRRIEFLAAGAVALVVLLWANVGWAGELDRPRIRIILGGEYWGTKPEADYPDYLAQVRPDVIHASVLGPELASTISSWGQRKAITAIVPSTAASMEEYLAWWGEYLKRLHRHGVRVQATFSIVNAWGDHEHNTGWFKYYNELWEEKLLGPRPAPHAADLMERDAQGALFRSEGDGDWWRYTGCVNNPAWRRALMAMIKAGVDAGFDGFMVQYPHARTACTCRFCQERFREFLRQRYSPDVFAQKFAITDLDNYVFRHTGPRPGMPGPIDVVARQFAAMCVKDCFEEVFVGYGRRLKPDLVLSFWSHFREFLTENTTNTEFAHWMDEWGLLPLDIWGRGEDYLWYSTPVYSSDRKNGILGDATLVGKYLRAMADRTPFEMLKYDYFRWRLVVGESLALGGVVFGARKGGWSGGADREEVHLKSYSEFIRTNDKYLFPRDSYAEVALLYPRTALYCGDCSFFEPLRRMGRALIRDHILFDFIIDQKMTAESLSAYRVVMLPENRYLSSAQEEMLDRYIAGGGAVIVLPAGPAPEGQERPSRDNDNRIIFWGDLRDIEAIATLVRQAAGGDLSRFDADWTVQVHADRQPEHNRVLVHFVNYNRDETRQGWEAPIAAAPTGVQLQLPRGVRAADVRFLTPEVAGEQKVQFTQDGDRVAFRTPGFLVYGLAVIEHR